MQCSSSSTLGSSGNTLYLGILVFILIIHTPGAAPLPPRRSCQPQASNVIRIFPSSAIQFTVFEHLKTAIMAHTGNSNVSVCAGSR